MVDRHRFFVIRAQGQAPLQLGEDLRRAAPRGPDEEDAAEARLVRLVGRGELLGYLSVEVRLFRTRERGLGRRPARTLTDSWMVCQRRPLG